VQEDSRPMVILWIRATSNLCAHGFSDGHFTSWAAQQLGMEIECEEYTNWYYGKNHQRDDLCLLPEIIELLKLLEKSSSPIAVLEVYKIRHINEGRKAICRSILKRLTNSICKSSQK
jgi:hypothetical protein